MATYSIALLNRPPLGAANAGRPGGGKPVFYAPSIGYYVVTSYDAIQQVFGDPRTYSAAVAQAPLAPLTPEAQQILLATPPNDPNQLGLAILMHDAAHGLLFDNRRLPLLPEIAKESGPAAV